MLIKTVRRNSFLTFLSSLVRLGTNAVLFILVARFYGPEAFGQFATALTLAGVFVLLADFGFDLMLTSEVARDVTRTSFLANRLLTVKLILAGTAAGLMAIYAFIPEMTPATRFLTLLFTLYLVFTSVQTFFFSLFRGNGQYHHETVITTTTNLSLLLVLAVLGSQKSPLVYVAGAFILSRLLGVLMAIVRSRTLIGRVHPLWDWPWIRSAIPQVLTFGVFYVFGNLYFLLDTVLLSVFKGDLEVGIYQSVFRIIAIVLIVPDITVAALLPPLSGLFPQDPGRWRRVGELAGKMLFFAGLGVGFILSVGAPQIIRLLYGLNEYASAVNILRIFGVTVFVRYAVEIPALMLTTSLRQVHRTLFVIGATILNGALNLFVIPRWGSEGAAVVSLVTNIAVGICYLVANGPRSFESWLSPRRAIPGVVMALGWLLLIHVDSITLWVGIGSTLSLFCLAVFRVGLTQEEKKIVRTALEFAV